MELFDLFEKSIYAKNVSHTTKHRRLYHLTDNYGLGISVETNTLSALRQDYISTTYRRETTDILGRHHYHYKMILDGKKLAKKYGVFNHDHHATEIGAGGSREVSLNEAEIGIDTREIDDLTDYLVGMVILSKPYTDLQVLFLADINKNQRGFFDVTKSETIHAITALNRLQVPLYWQEKEAFIPLTERDHEYLRDIERLMHGIENNKSRAMRHLDIVEKLLEKYDIRSNDLMRGSESLDKQIINRKRLVPEMMRMLNGYFRDRPLKDINPDDLKTMLIKMMKMMGYGGNAIAVVIGAADDCNFFHPVTEPVNWTGVIRELIAGEVDEAVADIKHFTPNKWAIENFNDPDRRRSMSSHAGTGMAGDDD